MLSKIEVRVGRIVEMLKAKKRAFISLVVTWGLIGVNTINAHASSISGNLNNASSGVQQEALNWLEALGLGGIVIGAIVYFSGNTKLAKNIIMYVAGGYVLIKFAPDLWKWFISIF